ncbi:MAG: hypothetical protein IT370_14175 [Deltaproteobacteria bacterium]|nr:hypothetical protein [Deltaproteobacteria bacterium]
MSMFVLVISLAGCPERPIRGRCSTDRPCADGLVCDMSAGGQAGICVAVVDGGLDGSADSGLDVSDGGPVTDASSTDAFIPEHPPITNGQSADLVLGQIDFTTTGANTGGEGPNSMWQPEGLESDGIRLWVSEFGNRRVLQFNGQPTANGAPADLALGQASMTSHSPGTSQVLVMGSTRIAEGGGRIFVSDRDNNRVLVWNARPTDTGLAADVVLGKTNFTSTGFGKNADQLMAPLGLWTDGNRLVVADTFNNRVLIWNSAPTSNATPADVVLGHSAFGIGYGDATGAAPTASSLAGPEAVHFDGERLYVADTGNNRVLVWRGMPTSNGKPADYVLGQSTFANRTEDAAQGSTNAVGFHSPRGVHVAHGSLFVCDSDNRRVSVFSPVPEVSATPASAVLGQPDLVTGSPSAPSDRRFGIPISVTTIGTKLFVADSTANRVLRFQLSP